MMTNAEAKHGELQQWHLFEPERIEKKKTEIWFRCSTNSKKRTGGEEEQEYKDRRVRKV